VIAFAQRTGIYAGVELAAHLLIEKTVDAVIFFRPIYNVLPHLHKYQC
jgi:hypothetical protein